MRLRNNLDEVRAFPEWTKEFEAYTERYHYEEDFYVLHMDGIIDARKWKNDGNGILLFAKASWEGDYRSRDYVQPQILRLKEATVSQLSPYFRTCEEWIRIIERELFARRAQEEECRLQSAALVNVSKFGDEATYGGCAAENAIICDGELLYRQLRAVAPKIVVCAGTAELFFELMRRMTEPNVPKYSPFDKRETRRFVRQNAKELFRDDKSHLTGYEYGNVLIFCADHPAAARKRVTTDAFYAACQTMKRRNLTE